MPANAMERDVMNRKIISVSKKRQITIPLQFYKHLNLDNEVEWRGQVENRKNTGN